MPGRASNPALDPIVNPAELRSEFLDTETLDWKPSQFDGIESKVLWADAASGRSTILFRLAPGAVVPAHAHTGVEQTWVISGTFGDDEGLAGPGGFIWRPAGSRHEAHSPDGAVILSMFDSPNDFDDVDGWYTDD